MRLSQELHSPNQRSIGALILFALVVLLSLGQFFVGVFVIPRFIEIYRDILGNRPLPLSTAMVLQCRWVFVGLAFFWPLAGFILVQRRALRRFLVCILAVLILSIAFTTISLFLPLSGTIIRSVPAVQPETVPPNP